MPEMLPKPRYDTFLSTYLSALGRYQPNKDHVLRLITLVVGVLAGRMENLGKDSRGAPKNAFRP